MKKTFYLILIAFVSVFGYAVASSTSQAASLSPVVQADVASKAATNLRQEAGWHRRRWRHRGWRYRGWRHRGYYDDGYYGHHGYGYRGYGYRRYRHHRRYRGPRIHFYIG